MKNPQHQLHAWLFFTAVLCAYTPGVEAQIPLDTSYTIASTYKKLLEHYPDIRIAEAIDAGEVREIADAVYKSIPETAFGNRDLHADLFIPTTGDNDKTFPVIILIHGGGWRSGNRSLNTAMATALATRGFAVVSIEYRLSLEAKYPAAIHDVGTAIRWTRAHGNEYHIDASNIALAGYSAGGQLASLLGVTNGNTTFDDPSDDVTISRQVQAVIDLDGLLDFANSESLAVKRNERSADVFWFKGTYEEIPGRWREASPLTWVDVNSPPFLFVNSSETRFHAGCSDMVSRLNDLGIYNEVYKLTNAPHSYWFFHPWFNPMIEYMTNFLNKAFHLK